MTRDKKFKKSVRDRMAQTGERYSAARRQVAAAEPEIVPQPSPAAAVIGPMEFCPYCGKEKPTAEFSDEHVVPAALGGNVNPTNPFLIRACVACNTTAGRHIDGPFVRSWFVQNDRAMHALRHVDVEHGSIFPFSYMGYIQDWVWEGRECEVWLGPTGDKAYHFHKPYPRPETNGAMVGRPLNARREEIDVGFVLLVIQATNPAWHRCILRSVLNQFPATPVYLANSELEEPHPRLLPVPPDHQALVDYLFHTFNAQEHKISSSIKTDAGDRFLGKLALGFGALLLGERYTKSDDAKRVRDFMWGQTEDLRAGIEVRGAGFMDTSHPEAAERVKQVVGWPAGHVFVVLPLHGALALQCIFYGSRIAVIEIAREPALWRDKVPTDGTVFIVSPTRQTFSGPHRLTDYIAARLHPDEDRPNGLAQYVREASREPAQPPRHLDGAGGAMRIRGRWDAVLYVGAEGRVLGTFDTANEAEEAYRIAAAEYKASSELN